MPRFSVDATYTFHTRGVIEADSEEEAEEMLLSSAEAEVREELDDTSAMFSTMVQELEDD